MEFESGCVLTGDIVRSASLEPGRLDAAFERLREAAAELLDWTDGRGLERFRGDGWQVAIAAPALALRAAMRLRAAVRVAGAETRGVGHIAEAGETAVTLSQQADNSPTKPNATNRSQRRF